MNLNDRRLNAYAAAAGKNTSGKKSGMENKTSPSVDKTKNKKTDDAEVRAAAAALTSGGLLKIDDGSGNANGKESIYRRVAKFLLIIGVDEAARILPHLSEEQTEKIIPEIASIRSVSADESTAILAEFQSLVKHAREGGGVDTARTILEKAFGEKKAEEMLQKSVPFAQGKPFDYLEEMDGERIYILLKDESSAVRALVLSHLKPDKAAACINHMPAGEKTDVVCRLAKMEPIAPEVLRRVDHAMHEKSDMVNTTKSESVDGRNALAQILKRMTPDAEQGILSTLSEQDPDLGRDLRNRLFTIDDILNSDDRFIEEQLRKMNDGDVAVLIAGKPADFRSKILNNMSIIRRNSVLEEEEIKKPILRKDSEQITSAFFAILRRAFEDGRLIVKGRSDDIYV